MSEFKTLTEEEMRKMALEARRRRDATNTGGASTLDDETCEFPFRSEDQQFAVLNFANVENRPRSIKPAFRLLKICDSQEEAHEFCQQLSEVDPVCAIKIAGVHGFYPISRNVQADPEQGRQKVMRNLSTHMRLFEEDAKEFARHKEELTEGVREDDHDDTPEAIQNRINANKARAAELEQLVEEHEAKLQEEGTPEGEAVPEGEEESKELTTEQVPNVPETDNPAPEEPSWHEQVKRAFGDGARIPSFPRDLETRGQSFFSFMLLKDYEDGSEPAVCILQTFATDDDARKYNKCVAAKQIDEHELHVHAQYEWVFPHLWEEGVTDRLKPLYRNEEENHIMSFMNSSKANVDEFTQQYQQRGEDAPCVEIEADLSEPAPRIHNRDMRAYVESGEYKNELPPARERKALPGFDDDGGDLNLTDRTEEAEMPAPDQFEGVRGPASDPEALPDSGVDRSEEVDLPAPDVGVEE